MRRGGILSRRTPLYVTMVRTNFVSAGIDWTKIVANSYRSSLSLPIFLKTSSANSKCGRVCAAVAHSRSRADPCGTAGKRTGAARMP
jgi:hypothetical protein